MIALISDEVSDTSNSLMVFKISTLSERASETGVSIWTSDALALTVATSAVISDLMALSWALIEAISSLSSSLFLMAVLISVMMALISDEVSDTSNSLMV